MTSDARQRLLLIARPAAGGIRSHIVSLLARLDRSRFAIELAAPNSLLDTLPADLAEFSRHVVPITAKPTPFDSIVAVRLARMAGRPNTIVHAHGIRAGFVAALARRIADFRLIVTYHNIPPESRLSTAVLSFIGARTDATIAVSNAIAQKLGDIRAVVIPNGIDLARYRNLDRANALTALGILDNRFTVACVARLSLEKGVDILLRAALLLPDIAFLIAGDGPERNRLESAAPSNVRFLGYVVDVRQVFAAADVTAIPSRSEGQGIVALEAMACGSAVIAAAVGGLRETIQDAQTGLLIESENPVALTNAIRRLSADSLLRKHIAAAGREWVNQNTDIDERTRQIEAVYERVAESH